MTLDPNKLEALLARVQRNASQPRRPATPRAEASAAAAPGVLELDEPGIESVPPQGPAVGIEFDLEDLPPESGSSLVRTTNELDRAFEAPDDDAGPPLTPPPESGEEPAAKLTYAKDAGPTLAQLGQTIALEEPTQADIELGEPLGPPSRRFEAGESLAPAVDESFYGDPSTSPEVEPARSRRPNLTADVLDFVGASKSFEPESFLELLDASLKL